MSSKEPEALIVIDNFSGGLNLRDSPIALRVSESRLIENVDWYAPHQLKPRRGITDPDEGVKALSSPAHTLIEYCKYSGQLYYVHYYEQSAGKPPALKRILGSSGAASVDLPAPVNNLFIFPPKIVECSTGLVSKLLIACGDNTLQAFDGTAVAAVTGTPPSNASFVEVHKRRVWTLGYLGETLSFSALNDYNDWASIDNAGSIVVPKKETCWTGLKSDGDHLYLFTQSHIYIIMGDDPFSFQVIDVPGEIGCISSESVVCVTPPGSPPVIMFAARDGFYAVRGQSIQRISDDAFPDADLLKISAYGSYPLPWIRGAQHKNCVFFTCAALDGSGATYTCTDYTDYVYNLETGTWCTMVPATDVGKILSVLSYRKDGRLFGISQTRDRLVQLPARPPTTLGSPDASALNDSTSGYTAVQVAMKYQTPQISPKSLGLRKWEKRFYILAEKCGGSLIITPVIDGVVITAAAQTVAVGTGGGQVVISKTMADVAQGRTIGLQIQFDGITSGQNQLIRRVEIYVDAIVAAY